MLRELVNGHRERRFEVHVEAVRQREHRPQAVSQLMSQRLIEALPVSDVGRRQASGGRRQMSAPDPTPERQGRFS